jgi:hypothetical protein
VHMFVARVIQLNIIKGTVQRSTHVFGATVQQVKNGAQRRAKAGRSMAGYE